MESISIQVLQPPTQSTSHGQGKSWRYRRTRHGITNELEVEGCLASGVHCGAVAESCMGLVRPMPQAETAQVLVEVAPMPKAETAQVLVEVSAVFAVVARGEMPKAETAQVLVELEPMPKA